MLTFDLHKICLELQVLTGSYAAADATYALLFPHAMSLQAKTDVCITMFRRFELEVNKLEGLEGGEEVGMERNCSTKLYTAPLSRSHRAGISSPCLARPQSTNRSSRTRMHVLSRRRFD